VGAVNETARVYDEVAFQLERAIDPGETSLTAYAFGDADHHLLHEIDVKGNFGRHHDAAWNGVLRDEVVDRNWVLRR
jgi:hypothetical protein